MQKLVIFDLQVSPQYISEEDNEMESENEILGTPKPRIYIVVLLYKSLPKPKWLRKSNKRKSYEYY